MLCECIRQRIRILARERRDILKLMEEIGLIMPLPPVVEDMDPYDIDPVDQPWARLHRLSRGSRREDSGEDLIFVLSIYCRYGTSDPAQAIVRANKEPAYLCTPMAYNKSMEFIESHIFEKQVNALLSDDEFALF
jgi:hypothetical protein